MDLLKHYKKIDGFDSTPIEKMYSGKTNTTLILKKTELKRGINEINAYKLLKGSSFARVLHFEVIEEHMNIVMTEIDGLTLEAIISEKKNEKAKQLKIKIVDNLNYVMLNFVRSLEEIHKSGVLHRDINPRNLMVGEDLSTYIIDFGGSVIKSNYVPQRAFVGTLIYMSPESVYLPETYDERSDFYSLGKIMIELIEGSEKFIDYHFKELLLKMSAIIPDQRFVSGDEIIKEMQLRE